MASAGSQVAVSAYTADGVCVLTVDGVLDSSTYRTLRDTVIKAALDEPAAVVVDVTALAVPAPSALSVFTSARWHVSTWPDVPILLVCGNAAGRTAIVKSGTTRYVPVFATIKQACKDVALGDVHRPRRRTQVQLDAAPSSAHRARGMVADSLTSWSQEALIPVVSVIVTAFVENALAHTTSNPVVVLEADEDTVTAAVRDNSSAHAVRHEHPTQGSNPVSGLAVVAALCRHWGSMPTPSGKTVWAVIGPENQL